MLRDEGYESFGLRGPAKEMKAIIVLVLLAKTILSISLKLCPHKSKNN